jgi:putative glutamine amidotransferase
MKVAVTMRVVASPTYTEQRDAISHDWIRLFDRFGIVPVLVPNVLARPEAFLREMDVKGLILTGGDDLGPLPSEGGGDRPVRDRTEDALLGSATATRLPVLGVCRGLQAVNAHFGGRVTRDVSAHGPHVAVRHAVRITDAPTASLGSWRGRTVETNSYHGQGVTTEDVAAPLRPFALAGSLVEGLYHRGLPIVAVQWHPERGDLGDLDRALLADWAALCG